MVGYHYIVPVRFEEYMFGIPSSASLPPFMLQGVCLHLRWPHLLEHHPMAMAYKTQYRHVLRLIFLGLPG